MNKVLEKPTDNELREFIKECHNKYDILFLLGIVIGIGLIIFGQIIYGLILGFLLWLLADNFLISQKLDKIRLEIRELKEVIKNVKMPKL